MDVIIDFSAGLAFHFGTYFDLDILWDYSEWSSDLVSNPLARSNAGVTLDLGDDERDSVTFTGPKAELTVRFGGS